MKRLLLLLFILLPGIVFAQASGGVSSITPIVYTPSDTDVSFIILNSWYGLVDNVLPGGTSYLFGQLFGIFNSGVLALAGIIVMYTLLMSTLQTAHDGKMLGEKFHSIWVPLRTVGGIALLIPKASGYSVIQIFMMWVAVQGIGLADTVWNTTVTYYLNGGITIAPITSPSSFPSTGGSSGGPVGNTTDILRSLTCMYMLQSEIAAQNPTQAVPDFFSSITNQYSTISATSTSGKILFPGPIPQYGFQGGECGSVAWAPVSLPSSMLDSNGNILPQYQSLPSQIATDKISAVENLINSLGSTAQQIVQNYMQKISPLPTSSALPLGGMVGSVWGNPINNNVTPPLFSSGNVIMNPAQSYISSLTPVMTLLQNIQSPSAVDANTAQTLTQGGWAVAGAVLSTIIQSANSTASMYAGVAALNTIAPSAGLSATPAITSAFNVCTQCVGQINDLVNGTSDYTVGTSGAFIKGASSYSATTNEANSSSFSANSISTGTAGGDTLLNLVLGALGGIGGDIASLEQQVTTNANPLLLAVNLGNSLINDFMTIWTVGYATAAGITVVLAIIPSVNVSNPINNMLQWFMGFLAPFVGILFTAGLTLTFYLPLIPYLLFTFGVIGWFITVLEAMVAAPLVAIGITHPEGHDILGKADPAVMLLVNVFLRPTLMIIGMLAGLSLSYAGLWLINYGFGVAWATVATNIQGNAQAFVGIGCIVIYCITVITILQRSFALVYIIPDEVFKWIGGSIKGHGGEEEMEGKVAGGFGGGASIAGQQMQGKIQGMKAGGGGGDDTSSGGESKGDGGGGGGENKIESK